MAKRTRKQKTSTSVGAYPNDSMKSDVTAAIEDPTFDVHLPWMLPTTWGLVESKDEAVRNRLRLRGRIAVRYALLLAFEEFVSEDDARASFSSMYNVGAYKPQRNVSFSRLIQALEECLLSEEVLSALLTKPHHHDVKRVTSEGVSYVSGGFNVFMGGLWTEAQLSKISPWVKTLFVPLFRVAVEGNTSSRNVVKRSRVDREVSETSCESQVLLRLRKLQLAKKPEKKPAPVPQHVRSSRTEPSSAEDDSHSNVDSLKVPQNITKNRAKDACNAAEENEAHEKSPANLLQGTTNDTNSPSTDLPDQTFCKVPELSADLVTVGTLYVSDDPFWCTSAADAPEPVPLLDAFTLKTPARTRNQSPRQDSHWVSYTGKTHHPSMATSSRHPLSPRALNAASPGLGPSSSFVSSSSPFGRLFLSPGLLWTQDPLL
ncbi:hypothetical protein B0H13DRAFT_1919546 [Mycena leptocephala]|nr:hypothetical protein B0H13DRAFT_1919546 [Mycena leptocephala]